MKMKMEDYKDKNQEEFVECFAIITALTLGVIAVYRTVMLILGWVS